MPTSIEKDRKTILLVEDETPIAVKEKSVLEEEGFKVITASNGQNAIQKADEETVDLVLMDIDLGKGKMDGTEAAEKILRDHEIPLVFLTGHTGKAYVEKVRKINNYGYVLKSSGEYVLIESINVALELYNTQLNLKKSREKYRTLVDNSPFGIVELDEDGYIISINKNSAYNLHFKPEELIGKNMTDILPDKLTEKPQEYCLKALREGTIQNFESEADGEAYHHRLVPMFTGEKPTVQIITEDITERKRTENELKEKKELFDFAVKSSNGALWYFDLDPEDRTNTLGDKVFMSPEYKKFLGYKPDEYPDLLSAHKQHILPEDVPMLEEKSRLHRSGKTDVYEAEYRIRHKDGGIRWILGRGKLLKDVEDRAIKFVGIDWDITEYKTALQEKETVMMELNHRVKNNLATITAMAHIELDGEEKTKEQAIEDIINRIDTIGALHELLYTGGSYSEIDMEVYIKDLTGKIHNSYAQKARASKVHFDIEPLRFPTKTATTIGIILTELLTNTFKYAETEGAEIEGALKTTISLQKHDSRVTLRYSDSGTGLSPEITSIEDLDQGTGLLIIKEFVAGLDGTIELDTTEGTAFRIVFED